MPDGIRRKLSVRWPDDPGFRSRLFVPWFSKQHNRGRDDAHERGLWGSEVPQVTFMTRTAASLLIVGLLLFLPGVSALGSNELKLGTVTAFQGEEASIPLTLSTTDQVQAVEAAFEWDAPLGKGKKLTAGPAIAQADLVVTRVEDSYMVLGVVVDNNGAGPDALTSGNDQLLATAGIEIPLEPPLSAEQSTSIRFVDGKYATVSGGPLLDNLVTVGGLSITKQQGLKLTDGLLTAKPFAAHFVYKIENGSATGTSDCGPVRVLMDSNANVEGYEVALKHPRDKVNLDSIEIGSAAKDNSADFTSKEVLPDGGVVGVVLDLVEPFQNNTIPHGSNLELAVFKYCCKTRPAAEPPAQHSLTFVNGELGNPPKDNTVVVGGVAFEPELRNGTFSCPPPEKVEICDNGIDDNGNDLIDCDDPECIDNPICTKLAYRCGAPTLGQGGDPLAATGPIGGTADVCFYYRSDEHPIQGLSIAACSDCAKIKPKEGSLDITGTIVESVQAEYVQYQADPTPPAGGPCELIIGILVDALPPFQGTTLPKTDVFLKLGCVKFDVVNNPALVGTCTEVQFCDDILAGGKVPIRNLVSIDNFSFPPQLKSCQVCIETGGAPFFRGDCNFSDNGPLSVDIADAAASMSFIFGKDALKFSPPCLDACDSNDDGKIDLADVSYLLHFLFQFGPFPPRPGPGFDENLNPTPPGTDPTPDDLDCKGQ